MATSGKMRIPQRPLPQTLKAPVASVTFAEAKTAEVAFIHYALLKEFQGIRGIPQLFHTLSTILPTAHERQP